MRFFFKNRDEAYRALHEANNLIAVLGCVKVSDLKIMCARSEHPIKEDDVWLIWTDAKDWRVSHTVSGEYTLITTEPRRDRVYRS